ARDAVLEVAEPHPPATGGGRARRVDAEHLVERVDLGAVRLRARDVGDVDRVLREARAADVAAAEVVAALLRHLAERVAARVAEAGADYHRVVRALHGKTLTSQRSPFNGLLVRPGNGSERFRNRIAKVLRHSCLFASAPPFGFRSRMYSRQRIENVLKESRMAATNINRVVLTGNLTRDPELRSTPSGTSVCSLRIACNTRRKDSSG